MVEATFYLTVVGFSNYRQGKHKQYIKNKLKAASYPSLTYELRDLKIVTTFVTTLQLSQTSFREKRLQINIQ